VTTCRDCAHVWTTKRNEHCTVCHETFAGAEPGDAHRIGEHGVTEGPTRRRCRTPDEMRAGGMWTKPNRQGFPVWHGRITKTKQQRRDTRHSSAEVTKNDPPGQTPTQLPPEKSGPQKGAHAL
jgi:hypothetical protein